MADKTITVEKRSEELEKAVHLIIERAKEMTPEQHVAKFKKIGFLTEEGEVAPEFQGVGELLTANPS